MASSDKGMATWTGALKTGKGTVSTESGALEKQPFGFQTRFESKPGTNPEELIGAAFAACFSMALSKEMEDAGMTGPEIAAVADVLLEETDAGFRITRIELDVQADASGEAAAFEAAVEATKANCPVANLLDTDIVYAIQRG